MHYDKRMWISCQNIIKLLTKERIQQETLINLSREKNGKFLCFHKHVIILSGERLSHITPLLQ